MSALKLLLRSRSLGFTRDKRSAARPTTLHTIPWGAGAIHYRPGTSDQEIIYQVLLKPGRKAEYWLPDEVRPKTILDIGGNIGVVSVYFAQRYPRARIFTVEPVPENFVVLAKNIAPYPNIKAYQIALGHSDGELTLRHSDNPINFGGFSVGAEGVHPTQSVRVRMQAVETFLADLDVPMIDLIKIDTEGAEFDVLTSVPERVLSQVRWIVGELHGRRDFELLAYLSRWFDIGLTKRIESRLFMFHARNKTNELPIQTA